MKIELNAITKNYKQGESRLQILKDLNLTVESGEIVAIIGESGSGKSTLLSLLAGFDRPDSGEIKWTGESTKSWDEARWARFRRKNMGFVFQNYYLIPYLTALENVALPLRMLGHSDPEAKAMEKLKQLGLAQRSQHLPSQLSGGECQRVAIGRAVIHDPELLLADEPTGSLDHKTGVNVLDLLFQQLNERRQTAILVTHSQEVASRCKRIYSLQEGRLCLQ